MKFIFWLFLFLLPFSANSQLDSNLSAKSSNSVFYGGKVAVKNGLIVTNLYNDYTYEPVNYVPITKYVNGSNIIDANVDSIYIKKMSGIYYKISKQYLTVKDFGATGDGITDDTYKFQKAVSVAAAWGVTLYVPEGTYIIKSTINIPISYRLDPSNGVTNGMGSNPWFTISLHGSGQKATYIKFEGKHIAGQKWTPIFNFEGGSGNTGGGGIDNMMIIGKGVDSLWNTGIRIDGRCGVYSDKLTFYGMGVGYLLNNTHPGSFSEYDVLDHAVFIGTKDCMRMESTGGDVSYHGSGMTNFLANISTGSHVVSLQGAMPYGSPLSGSTFFNNQTLEPIVAIASNSNANVNFYGHLDFENVYCCRLPANQDDTICNIIAKSNHPIYLQGGWSSYNWVAAGDLKIVDWMTAGISGTPYGFGSSQRQATAKMDSASGGAGFGQAASAGCASYTVAEKITLIARSAKNEDVFFSGSYLLTQLGCGKASAAGLETISAYKLPSGFVPPAILDDGYGNYNVFCKKIDGSSWGRNDINITIITTPQSGNNPNRRGDGSY